MKTYITPKEKALAIIKAYKNNPGWEEKVKKMSPWQIFAIYDDLVKRGVIYYDDKKKEASVREKGEEESTEKEAH